ncbi:asparaginase [Aquibacillus rhizosphaerae]|uniref:Asparaginase n=1 Tax=Aquibacillus rhizosphaerae TaxID=3051431 RepID=A0ABT7L5C1_9BACI|nr:asparaginase [Aquibacillus sp. LR5S19]MDL4841051.1 asparaginase [Aquibacillus sp. LR5S19]
MKSAAIKVYRGEHLESTHEIHIAIINTEGDLIAYFGDAQRPTFARSSLKPFQAVPSVESGATQQYSILEQELAIFCGSHNGEDFHRQTVSGVLEKIGLNESHLQCGTQIPRDMNSYKQLIKNGGELTPIYSNCSGKHAGMLVGCMNQNFDLHRYREMSHPYQQQVLEVIANISDYNQHEIKMSVDGCGLPVHSLPLNHIAIAFGRLATPEKWHKGSELRKNTLNQIREAMVRYPEMVAGTKRFDTDLMKAFNGEVVAKLGAEGVHCFGIKSKGIGVAIKVEDGNERATNVASMEVLRQLGIRDSSVFKQLKSYHYAPVLNARKEKIGEIIPDFQLTFS